MTRLQKTTKPKHLKLTIAIVLIIASTLTFHYRFAIADNISLYNYTPAAAVSQLAHEATMTKQATRIFHANNPNVQNKSKFRNNCPKSDEKTIVLGCYKKFDGIYILEVDDKRLDGVEQVTAAHEMLHSAYDRLGFIKKHQVNQWLEDYLKNNNNRQLAETIDNYRSHGSTHGNVINELHSILGSEVADLPPQLENYYRRYFTNRKVVTNFAKNYRDTFNKLNRKINDYDQRLSNLRSTIKSKTSTLDDYRSSINRYERQMDNDLASGNTTNYNSLVPQYNTQVRKYNSLAKKIQSSISLYNKIVEKRNNIATNVNFLNGELNANVGNTKPLK